MPSLSKKWMMSSSSLSKKRKRSNSPKKQKMMILVSCDKEEFQVPEKVIATQSATIRNMIYDGGWSDGIFPILDVEADIMALVIRYCSEHAYVDTDEAGLKAFDEEFVSSMDQHTLCKLRSAAKYLNIKGLVAIVVQKIADLCKVSKKTVILVSCDKKEFKVPEKVVATQSETIRNMIIDGGWSDGIFPIPDEEADIMALVIRYCSEHAYEDADEADLKAFDEEFVSSMDLYTLCQLISAANYLNIKGLVDILCQELADLSKGSIEDVRKIIHEYNQGSGY